MDCGAELFIPKLGFASSSELSSRWEIKYTQDPAEPIVEPRDNDEIRLLEHQERARRALRHAKSALFIHHTGQGKTLTMLASALDRLRSLGKNGKVFVIAKENMHHTIADQLAKLTLIQEERSKFIYTTYKTFSREYSEFSPVQLLSIFKDSVVVVDEFHSVQSEKQEHTEGSGSLHLILARIRILCPDILMIAMTATPMLNDAGEIRYVKMMLDPPPLTADIFTNVEAVNNELMNQINARDPLDIAHDLVENAIICYKESHAEIAPRYIGHRFRLTDDLYQKIADPVTIDYAPMDGSVIRRIIKMGPVQSGVYVNNFTTMNFWREARQNSTGVKYPEEASALFNYWLELEKSAWTSKHAGVGIWYFDDLVEDHAKVFYELFLRNGWVDASTDPAVAPEAPRVLLITGKQRLTNAMRNILTSFENYDGKKIRTVVYSQASRDGMNVYNALRIGGVAVWNRAAQLQALSRGLRIGSFDEIIRQGLADPEFLARNAIYFVGDRVAPLICDAVSIPDTSAVDVRNGQIATLQSKSYSTDLHMLTVQSEKDGPISEVFKILVAGSIDEQARKANINPFTGNYYASYASTELRRLAFGTNKFSAPLSMQALTSAPVSKDCMKWIAERIFAYSDGYIHEGPLQGSNWTRWSTGAMGMGPEPISASEDAGAGLSEIKNLNVLQLCGPVDQQIVAEIERMIEKGIRAFAKLILSHNITSERTLYAVVDSLTSAQLAAEIGVIEMLCMAMYVRYWCTGITPEYGISFGITYAARAETAESEALRAFNWKHVKTLHFGTKASDPATLDPRPREWLPPVGGGKYADQLTFAKMQEILLRGNSHCIVVSHMMNVFRLNIAEVLQILGLPANPVASVRGAGVAKERPIIPFPGSRDWSYLRLQTQVHEMNPMFVQGAKPLVERNCVIDGVEIPMIPGKEIPRKYAHAHSNASINNLKTVAPGQPGHAMLYIDWARQLIISRFKIQWILQPE